MYNIGIDLGGTNIAAGLVDENYNIIRKTSVETKASRPADEITKDMAKVCRQLCHGIHGIVSAYVKEIADIVFFEHLKQTVKGSGIHRRIG